MQRERSRQYHDLVLDNLEELTCTASAWSAAAWTLLERGAAASDSTALTAARERARAAALHHGRGALIGYANNVVSGLAPAERPAAARAISDAVLSMLPGVLLDPVDYSALMGPMHEALHAWRVQTGQGAVSPE